MAYPQVTALAKSVQASMFAAGKSQS